MKKELKQALLECALSAAGQFMISIGQRVAQIIVDEQSKRMAEQLTQLDKNTPFWINPNPQPSIQPYKVGDFPPFDGYTHIGDRPSVTYGDTIHGTGIIDCKTNGTARHGSVISTTAVLHSNDESVVKSNCDCPKDEEGPVPEKKIKIKR